MLRTPPDILITTPESLFLMLTSQARRIAANGRRRDPRRGPRGRGHEARRAPRPLASSASSGSPASRSSASGSPRRSGPLEEIGRFVSGGRPTRARGRRPSEGARPRGRRPARGHARARRERRAPERHPGGRGPHGPLDLAVHLPAHPRARRGPPLDDPLRQQPPARGAARPSPERARGEGDRARPPRLARARAAPRGRGAPEARRDPVPRRDLVARARDRHGRGRPRHPGRVAQVGRRRAPAGRARRPPARRAVQGPHLPEVPGGPRSNAPSSSSGCARARSRRRASRATRSTSSRSRSSRSRRRRRSPSTTCTRSSGGPYPFRDLSRAQLENVLDMLAGRYPSEEFAELRPRIIWDRVGGLVRGREGARRLAVTNAGTIPDRGLFGVFLVDGGGRVGELDEEMVYEARAGQTFLLGASTWRIEEITRDRVLVSPAPGIPGAVPFWKGEGVGRPYELGEAIGRTAREVVGAPETSAPSPSFATSTRWTSSPPGTCRPSCASRRARPVRSRPTARWSWSASATRSATGGVCVLTPFGGRVHAPWSLALAARLRESLGLDVSSIWSDDGIALHLPDAEARRRSRTSSSIRPSSRSCVIAELGRRALFGARFRENAARALLIPRRRPGQRTPLWQQRLKAQALLQVARRYPDFPVVLETVRECLQDVFDLPALAPPARRPAGPPRRSRLRRDGRPRRPSPPRSSSTTSPRTCTRTTRPWRSGARRRSRSTATC